MILIAYDGSDDAKAALEHIAEFAPGQPAVVVTVWEPYVHLVTRYPSTSTLVGAEDSERIDDASRVDAERTAQEGAALARTHGLDAVGQRVARAAPARGPSGGHRALTQGGPKAQRASPEDRRRRCVSVSGHVCGTIRRP